MEQLRKKFGRPLSGAGSKRKLNEPSKLEPTSKIASTSPPTKTTSQKPKPVQKEEKKMKGEEGKKNYNTCAKEFNTLKDYTLIIVGIPTIEVEESPNLKVIKLPYMAPEKLTSVLKETKGWDETNHAVVVIPRAWSDIEGADDMIYKLMDVLENLSATLELSFLAPPIDDKTPKDVHRFIDRVKSKMILHDLPPAKFQSRGRICQKWYANAIKGFVNMIMEKEKDTDMKSISDISLNA
uniref:Uncharacterized protein n=1 Tax=Panagrolaimus superbus TaxID=310955 RepID=A0A914YAZ3_9BILA